MGISEECRADVRAPTVGDARCEGLGRDVRNLVLGNMRLGRGFRLADGFGTCQNLRIPGRGPNDE